MLTQSEVEAVLHRFGFKFTSHGHVEGALGFSSLRAAHNPGIYFLSPGACLPTSASGSVVLVESMAEIRDGSNAYIEIHNPQFAFYTLMSANEPTRESAGLHPSAIIDPSARISPTAQIGAFCIVESDVEIGPYCRLDSHVVIKAGTKLGERVSIEPHSTIGATGVAWAWDDTGERRIMQPQTGGVLIGNDVFLGSDVTVVRGSVNEMTEIGDYTVIAHGSKIGHGCRIGSHAHLANNVSLAGNVDAGDRTFFGSGAVVRPRVRIAAGVVVGAGAVVVKDIDTQHVVVGGVPARLIGATDKKLSGVPGLPAE